MMLEIQFGTWSVMLALMVIYVITYRIGMSQIQRRYIPTEHLDYYVKRALFISYISLSEIMFAFLVNIEMALGSQFIFQNEDNNTQCPWMTFAYQLNCVSYVILAGIFLSIGRCLAQRFALGTLSKSDITSMTRVYLVPSTCIVTAFCVSSWFRLWGRMDQNNRACYSGDRGQNASFSMTPIRSSRIAYCVYFVVGIFVTMLHDFVECRSNEKNNDTTSRQFHAYSTSDLEQIINNESSVLVTNEDASLPTTPTNQKELVKQDSISKYKESVVPIGLQCSTAAWIVPMHKAPDQCLEEEEEDDDDDEGIPVISAGKISNRTRTPFCRLFYDFLRHFTRLFVSVTVYGVLVLIVYEYMESVFSNGAFDDVKTTVFTAMLVINGVLRIVQIQASEFFETEAKKKKIPIGSLEEV